MSVGLFLCFGIAPLHDDKRAGKWYTAINYVVRLPEKLGIGLACCVERREALSLSGT